MSKKGRFGIIASGGPAPGINGVISASVIEAVNQGYEIVGFQNGFKCIYEPADRAVVELSISQVSSIYNTGGSIIGMSRFNPFHDPVRKARFIELVRAAGVDKLIVIGGEGSAYLSNTLGHEVPDVRVVHIPKTIDNDLVLPSNHPSFGFETARYAGTQVMDTLMTDAKSCHRWFLVTCMGRKAGFLALGLGIASGAHITLIPEEFRDHTLTAQELAEVVFGSIKTRYKIGKPYGVALIAEGVLDCLDPDSSPILQQCPRDEMGRLMYSQVELGDVIRPHLKEMAAAEKFDVGFYGKNIGYELRCHPPVGFDIEYTKLLGYGAVKYLLEGRTGIMVTKDFDSLGFIPLAEIIRPDGSILARGVDLNSDLYKVAQRFMQR